MKTALKIGFHEATQHWKAILLQSKLLIGTFILITLLESLVLFEASQLLRWLDFNDNYYRSGSLIGVNLLDSSNTKGSLGNYLLDLTNNFFFELSILNTFFLGVYYHHTGFPTSDTPSRATIDNVLDEPIENKQASFSQVMTYTEKDSKIHYFRILIVFIVLGFVGDMFGRMVYDISIVIGYTYYWLFRLLPYFLLLLLYLKWLNMPFNQLWQQNHKWVLILVFMICVPTIGSYVFGMIYSALSIFSYISSVLISETDNLMRFLSSIIYIVLLVPFLSVFYSQTLIYLKNEQEA